MNLKNILLNEGKSKIIFSTENKNEIILEFKDHMTAYNGQKKENIENKGHINKEISLLCFKFLEKNEIKTHFIKDLSHNKMLCHALTIFPIEVMIRNIVAGSLKNRIGLPEGFFLERPLCELYYKNDDLGDPLLNEDHIDYLKLADMEEVKKMKAIAFQVNKYLKSFFLKGDLILVDFKLEFGKNHTNEIYIADEISPDSCRIWEKENLEILDKDRFRKNIGNIIESYTKILNQLKKE